jgi:hypothetical protein
LEVDTGQSFPLVVNRGNGPDSHSLGFIPMLYMSCRGKCRRGSGRDHLGGLAGLDPGGLCPFHHDVGLGRPMASSNVLGCFGGSCVPSGTCGWLLRPKKA